MRDINAGEIPTSYLSLNVSSLPRVVMSLVYKYNILSSIDVNRVWYFGIYVGSKLPSLSCSTLRLACSFSVRTGFEE